MTLAPSKLLGPRLTLIDDADVRVVEELGDRCMVPGCRDWAEQGSHHIEPRSRTAGPRMFVVIDRVVHPNRAKLCTKHHRMITGGIGGHAARLVWHDVPTPHWCWCERTEKAALYSGAPEWYCVGPLRLPYYPEVCEGDVEL